MRKMVFAVSLVLVGCVIPPYQSYTPSAPAPSIYDYPQQENPSSAYYPQGNSQSAYYPQNYEQNDANYDNRVRVDVYHHQVEPQRPTMYPNLNEPNWKPSFGSTLGSGLSGAY